MKSLRDDTSTAPMSPHRTLSLVTWIAALAGCTGPGHMAEPTAIPPAEPNAALYFGAGDDATTSPVKHVVIVIGENRSFDHIFATYKPRPGQTIDNLLSKGIVTERGMPGPNFRRALQYRAVDGTAPRAGAAGRGKGVYEMAPGGKIPYDVLPAPALGGREEAPASDLATAQKIENGLPDRASGSPDPDWYALLTTGATGLVGASRTVMTVVGGMGGNRAAGASGPIAFGSHPRRGPDLRIPRVTALPPGPFQLTPAIPYDAYSANPVHRFYQMWQELDCSAAHATVQNPSGCLADLFPWVETTVGAGSDSLPLPPGFDDLTTGEGATAMGVYNMLEGDAPYFAHWADTYAMSDNFHQAVQGGTCANHLMMGTGDTLFFSDGDGNPATPPTPQIENPDPQPGTNNFYIDDGYGIVPELPQGPDLARIAAEDAGIPSVPLGGGSYSDCSDPTQPGVGSILRYLAALPHPVDSRCAPRHFYLLNNYGPPFLGDGAAVDRSDPARAFTLPPSSVPTIGDQLRERHISFAYFGDQFDRYLADGKEAGPRADQYCNVCNFFQYSKPFMSDPSARAHLKDTRDLYEGLARGWLPAVSFVKPSALVDGHPASSKVNLLEGFVKKVVDLIQANPRLWNSTLILVTMDEGGGYWDSGYVQAVDFFGDGTRVPLVAISPLTTGGRVSHEYTDHVSILKFIERNWSLRPISDRSRDNLPNPKQDGPNPYAPTNSPAIGDLFDLLAPTTR
jgi:phospholipase C